MKRPVRTSWYRPQGILGTNSAPVGAAVVDDELQHQGSDGPVRSHLLADEVTVGDAE